MKLLNEIVPHYYKIHSLITPVPHNGKEGRYRTLRNHVHISVKLQMSRVLLIGDSIIANFSKFSSISDKNFSKFHHLSFGIKEDNIQNALWRMNNLSFPPSLQYIFFHCGTNNIDNNNLEVISDGLIILARVKRKSTKM